ncbi:DUF4167 domain-containing protein [Methylobacterium sp. Gmos1]
MRGRNRSNNKGPNPLTRAYESNGPDVKIRGTAQHIAEKYAQLARDAQASGDPVMAENYFQHGEHYFRIIAAANEQYRQQYGGTYGRQGYDDEDDGDDEGAPTNGYQGQDRGHNERGANGYAQSGYGAADDYGDPGQQPQPYDNRGDDRPSRFDRQDHQRQDQPRQDQQRQDRPDRQERRERFQNRQERQQRERQERTEQRTEQRAERQDRPERQDPSRAEQPRQEARQEPVRQEPVRQDGYREGGRSEFRRERRREEPRSEPVLAADEPTGLPAFLTTPVRPVASTPAPVEEAPPAPPATPVEAEGDAPAPRPRRRRRTRFEGTEGGGEPSGELFPKPADSSGE